MAYGVWVGIQEVQAAMARATTLIDEAGKKAIVTMAADVEKRAKANFQGTHRKGQRHVGGDLPNVVTGNLRRSIQATKPERDGAMGWVVRVSPGANYALFVEQGTRGRGGYPFFEPAVHESEGSWGQTVANEYAKLKF